MRLLRKPVGAKANVVSTRLNVRPTECTESTIWCLKDLVLVYEWVESHALSRVCEEFQCQTKFLLEEDEESPKVLKVNTVSYMSPVSLGGRGKREKKEREQSLLEEESESCGVSKGFCGAR